MAQSRFIVVDDHPLFRDALRQTIARHFPHTIIEEAGALDGLIRLLQDAAVETDLVLLDLQMPDVSGLSGLLQVRTQFPAVPVAIVSGVTDPKTIRRALDFGATAYVPKSEPIENIRAAIDTVLQGGVWTPPGFDTSVPADEASRALAGRLSSLTPQQLRVLGMLGEGLLNKQIAYKLNVSEATIKAHVSAILQKLDVDSRTQAVIAIARSGLSGERNPQLAP
jgi:DNA-binding NarL/FixJ family response regulator